MISNENHQRKLTLADIAHVGPGTPGGEWLRRYWLAVFRSEDLRDIPQAIRLLGEDLVLFRDPKGQLGLMGLHCPHRGTSLEYGDIEDRGIRCPYHGWLFDVSGQCLEQPAEPKGSTFHQKIRHLSYPVRELGGLIFAYMGPESRESLPALPLYSSLVRDDGQRAVDPPRNWNYNWFNFFENAPDLLHAYILHKDSMSARSWENAFWNYDGSPSMEANQTDFGMIVLLRWPGPTAETEYVQLHSIALPNVFAIGGHELGEDNLERVLFVTPVDDSRVVVFNSDFCPGADSDFMRKRHEQRSQVSRSELKQYDRRKYAPFRGHVWKEDYVCQVTQGTIGYRKETLASSDKAVILLRKIILEAIKTLQDKSVPKGIVKKDREQRILRLPAFKAIKPRDEIEALRASIIKYKM